MKIAFVLCLVFVSAYSWPAYYGDSDEDASDETYSFFPFRKRQKFNPSVVEVDAGDTGDSFYPMFFRPFFFNPFKNLGFSDFFENRPWFPSLTPKTDPDNKVKNATSTTKVVDGHKIVVNETTYENEKNGAVFRFQIIQVSPFDKDGSDEKEISVNNRNGEADGEVEPQPVTEENASTESAESSSLKPDSNQEENEIKNKEEMSPANTDDELKA